MAAAAPGLPARGQLGAIDTRDAPMRHAPKCRTFEVLSIGHVLGTFRQRFEERLRALVRCAQRMKPQRHLSLPKEVGKAFAEAQVSALDGPGAAAALGATACGGYK